MARVEAAIERLQIPIELRIAGEVLDDRDWVFGSKSRFYATDDEREAARLVAETVGERLEPSAPLGYRDLQAAVVFDWACPNTTLPILRKRGTDWIPPFERALWP